MSQQRWYQVLGVAITAPAEELRTAFKRLALRHHPDKGGDADAFKRVKDALEEGLRAALRRVRRARPKRKPGQAPAAAKKQKAGGPAAGKKRKPGRPAKTGAPRAAAKRKPDAEAGGAGEGEGAAERAARRARKARADLEAAERPQSPPPQKRPRYKPVSGNASRTKVCNAFQWWHSEDNKEPKTMPDEIPAASPGDVADWIRAGSCAVLDVRESHERCGPPVPGSVDLAFHDVVMATSQAPGKVVDALMEQVQRVREGGRRIVVASQSAPRMGPCGLVGALIRDIFGLDDGAVLRLDGGYTRWHQWLEDNSDIAKSLAAEDHPPPASPSAKARVDKAGAPPPAPAAHGEAPSPSQAARKARAKAAAHSAQAAAQGDRGDAGSPRVGAASAELAAHEAAVQDHLGPLLKGTWEDPADVTAHLSKLSPHLSELGLDVSMRLMLPKAAAKLPPARGMFDKMVLDELEKRFEQRLVDLRAAAVEERVRERAPDLD